MPATVHVVSSHPALRRQLALDLEAALGVPVEAFSLRFASRSASVVVTPATDCSPAECARIVAAGARVLILATVPFEEERERYLKEGAAAYIPMTAGSPELARAVARVLASSAAA